MESREDEICGGKKAEDRSVRIGNVQGTGNRKRQGYDMGMVKVKVKQSRYRPGVAQRVPGS